MNHRKYREVNIMSVCYTAPYAIPAATLGPENPLPDIKNISYIHAEIESTQAVPKRLTTYINKGMVDTMLPYTQQDNYDRDRVQRLFKAVIAAAKGGAGISFERVGLPYAWIVIPRSAITGLHFCASYLRGKSYCIIFKAAGEAGDRLSRWLIYQ